MARHQSYGAAPSERKGERLPIMAAIAETWRRRRDRKVIGEVRYQDLVLADNRALLAARAAERGAS